MLAAVTPTAFAPQPFAVQEVRPGQVGEEWTLGEQVDGFPVVILDASHKSS
ncbi:hypothetical protein [Streptomyces violaceusniger]|uniref:hypothetical protein n=1 Tax=Streptomyces violaceusniger TaxID=68280 RepID=UPI00142F38D5|nr:hypothetical protein [Streptomyces violaceusniger]